MPTRNEEKSHKGTSSDAIHARRRKFSTKSPATLNTRSQVRDQLDVMLFENHFSGFSCGA